MHVHAPLLGVEPEGLQSALLAQRLRLVDELVAAVVPRAGVSFGVLVGHHRADGFHHRTAGEVLGGDELEALPLPRLLLLDDLGDLGIHLRQGLVARLGPRHVSLRARELLVLIRVGDSLRRDAGRERFGGTRATKGEKSRREVVASFEARRTDDGSSRGGGVEVSDARSRRSRGVRPGDMPRSREARRGRVRNASSAEATSSSSRARAPSSRISTTNVAKETFKRGATRSRAARGVACVCAARRTAK